MPTASRTREILRKFLQKGYNQGQKGYNQGVHLLLDADRTKITDPNGDPAKLIDLFGLAAPLEAVLRLLPLEQSLCHPEPAHCWKATGPHRHQGRTNRGCSPLINGNN